MKHMKAIGYVKGLPIEEADALVEKEIPLPNLEPHDVLVKVEAISINPVDTKARKRGMALGAGEFHVPGWDVVGRVVEKGSLAKSFSIGDEVFYAGSIRRSGANSEFHAVDERIVGRKPKTLSSVEAAALPLTSLTAWEALFDRMKLTAGQTENYRGKSLLIIGGSGGVGSVAIQLAKKLIGITVVASASRPESQDWCRELGADFIVDHSRGLVSEFRTRDLNAPDYILCTANTDDYFDSMAELIKPQGAICSIVETKQPHDIGKLMQKSATFAWELMFTRSSFFTDDMAKQGIILNEIARLVDSGTIRGTANVPLGPITLANVKRGHALIESGRAIGKVVLGEVSSSDL